MDTVGRGTTGINGNGVKTRATRIYGTIIYTLQRESQGHRRYLVSTFSGRFLEFKLKT